MSIDKKVISKITTMVIVLAVIALVIAKLYDIGTHRPSLAYRQLSPETIFWINNFNRLGPEGIIQAAPVGPFEWDNKADVGQKRTAGTWGKEEDANTIIYYRKDRSADSRTRAIRVMKTADDIIRELSAYLGTYHYPRDLNGRKMPIYLPDKDEYAKLLSKLSDGASSNSKYGTSIIAVGPLGCQCKGIILHPDGFVNNNAEGDLMYIRVLRRELAYYTYMANLDYNKNTQRYAWFVSGITEHFSLDGKSLPPLPSKTITQIRQDFKLNAEYRTTDNLYKVAGTSFIEFYEMTFGSNALSNLIQATYTMPVDSALMQIAPDLEMLKQQWLTSIEVESQSEQTE